MANEKEKPKPERVKIEVKTRTPKGPGIFDSVGRNRQDSGIHPLREIIDFPAEENTLDSQRSSSEIANADTGRNIPDATLDSQIVNIGNTAPSSTFTTPTADGLPNNESLDIQTTTDELPDVTLLDSQTEMTGLPNDATLDIHSENTGKPNDENLARKLADDVKPENDRASHIANAKNLASQKPVEVGKWNKYDKARSTETVFVRADAELVNEIKHFNVTYKLQMREFFELAASAFIENAGKPKPGDLASNIASDERRLKIEWKTQNSIINLYEGYNRIFSPKTIWRPGDDKLGAVYNEIPIEIVEMGIIETQVNKLQIDPDCQINSFKYYSKQINFYLSYESAGKKMLGVMVEIGRKRWREATGREVDLSFLESGE